MSFFKDFKEDMSQAMNELVDDDPEKKKSEKENKVQKTESTDTTSEGNVDVKSELAKLDGLLDQVSVKDEEPEFVKEEPKPAGPTASEIMQFMKNKETKREEAAVMSTDNKTTGAQEEIQGMLSDEISDETTVITAGTSLKGNLESTGSIDIRGAIDGNVSCNGKLIVTGQVKGNSTAAEFFADAAKIEGEIVSTGTVKIGLGSVVIGNIAATSAVIAGAIKGDIDVQGPVVVDTSAVVMGNIKSRSVQINNGAVIEGFCSQSYAEVDVQSLFDGQEQA